MAVAKVETIRKRQLAQAVVEKTGVKLKTANALIDLVFDEIATSMVKGKKVNVKDFGIFKKAQTKARWGRNPATGEKIKIKASVKARFTPSKVLKESMVSKKYEVHCDQDALTGLGGTAPTAKKTAKKTTKKR